MGDAELGEISVVLFSGRVSSGRPSSFHRWGGFSGASFQAAFFFSSDNSVSVDNWDALSSAGDCFLFVWSSWTRWAAGVKDIGRDFDSWRIRANRHGGIGGGVRAFGAPLLGLLCFPVVARSYFIFDCISSSCFHAAC
jgi:hypothetical protein